jgi:integrase
VGRPPLDRETYGEIRVSPVSGGKFEARCYYRDRRGKTSQPSARADTDPAARRALKKKLTDYQAADANGKITRDSRFREVAEAMLQNVRREAQDGAKSHNTYKAYQTSLKTVCDLIGELRMWEFEESVDVVSDAVQEIKESQSYESAKKARTVISKVATLAIMRKAIKSNPVRSIEALTRAKAPAAGEDDGTPAMNETHIQDMLLGLVEFCTVKVATPLPDGRRLGKRGAVWEDLPELAEASLATGTRFGETLALTADDVAPYLDEKTGRARVAVLVDAHLVRRRKEDTPEGEDLVARVPGRKSNQPGILVRVPTWSEPMFLRRKADAASGASPLFPNFGGGWLDQDNANKRLREALDGAGFGWVTAKVWRKTLGVFMRQAGKSAQEVAAQLGNTPAVAQRHYMGRPTLTEVGAEVLELIKPRREPEVFPIGKPSEETIYYANQDHRNGVRPGSTVGTAGIEPATARRSNDHRPRPTQADSPATESDQNLL